MAADTDVEVRGHSLSGKSILLGITGGIAATEAVRLCRELRRYGAEITVIMTTAAAKVITPLAVEWAAQGTVITDWDSEMAQLKEFDGILIAPATRNFLARYSCGMMDHPLLMACSAARGRGTPIIVVPSMHTDLFDDPVTEDILANIGGADVLLGPYEEDRFKQPSAVQMVAELSHRVNSGDESLEIVVTLGATRAPIDSVRAIQNTSSGTTGWKISEFLFRQGHNVIVVAGVTSVEPSFDLPKVIRVSDPDEMLSACMNLATKASIPNGWIYTAAILDYYTKPISGKKSSDSDTVWDLKLSPGPKHIEELGAFNGESKRIGFKLETQSEDAISKDDMVELLKSKALRQIEKYGVDATIGNILEYIDDPDMPRGYLITKSDVVSLVDMDEMCAAILQVLTS